MASHSEVLIRPEQLVKMPQQVAIFQLEMPKRVSRPTLALKGRDFGFEGTENARHP